MYQPAVNLTKPIELGVQRMHMTMVTETLTKEAEEDPGPSEPTRGLVPILEHLEHGSHLPAGIYSLVFDDDKLVLRRTVNLDDAVERFRRIGRDDVEPGAVLIQYELVTRETRGGGGRRSHAHRSVRRFRLVLLLLLLVL
jgi:hypothetical protein